MLRRHLLIAATTAAAVLLPVAHAAAIMVDMSFGHAQDPFQVVPLGPDRVLAMGGNAWPRAIATPDGSLWSNTGATDPPIAHTLPGGSTTVLLPALVSGQLPSDWARGSDGRLWFTEAGPPDFPSDPLTMPAVDRIGRLDPATNAVVEFGGLSTGANAQTIAAGPDGNIWFLEFGTDSVGRIAPNGAVTEFQLPPGLQLVRERGEELTVGPGGDMYFLTNGGIARMTTAGTFAGFLGNSGPAFSANAIAYGRDGNLWATTCNPDAVVRISPTGAVTISPDGTFPGSACPMGMTAGPDGTVWLYEWNSFRLGRVVFQSPLATTDDPTAVRPTTADINGEAVPRGAATTIHFEYGTTTAYGSSTAPQAIGDGDDPVAASASLTGLGPSSTYHYRLVATNVIGTVTGADQTITTSLAPPPPPPPPPVDHDGDGYPQSVDCDDLSAAIHRGATDKPGNRIDEDCSGADAGFERFQPHASAGFKRLGHGRVAVTRLVIDAMPADSHLQLSCTGPGCALKSYSVTIAKSVQRLDITKRLRGAKLRKGARVELTLSRPGSIATVVRWTVGPPTRVAILCLPPGAKKPAACS
ncbi:MAG: MopE-related protein [Baekduia sp.]